MSIVEPIVSKTTEVAYTAAFRHIGYLFQYNENIHILEVETQGLEDILRRINEMVVRSQRNAEDVEPDVEKWQENANRMRDEVVAFLVNKVRSNSWCVNCWCPNPIWRYRLGKESKLKTSCVIGCRDRGTKFLTVLPLSRPAPPPEHPLTSHEAFDSRQEIFNGIMEAIKDPTIKMVGVHGAGGVGKTTIVKEVAYLAKKSGLFDDVAFAVVSRNLDKKKLQGELAAELGLKLDEHGRSVDRLWTRLQNGKKNLVILDDVWDPLNLEDIGIPTTTDHGNKEGCCKVLVTSRKQLLHRMTPKPADQSTPNVSIIAPVASIKEFYIPVLEKKEAWSLFMKTAEISLNSNQENLSAAKKVCDECGGLPIAILALATALKGKEWYAWRDALTLLKNSNFDQIVDIDPNLFSSLKLSYDYLEPRDARSCFLLCSLFPEDAGISIEDLVMYSFGMRLLDPILSTTLENVRNRVLTLVKSLKASCLLLEGKDDNTVKMHDVIRDVAILIAKGEKRYLVSHDLKKWPEGGTYDGYLALSLKSEFFLDIPSELGCKELRTLVLRSKDCKLPDSFFNGMETNLEVLDLSGMAIESLPPSLLKLVKLRMLLLPNEVSDISCLGELKSLEILRVNGIKRLTPEIGPLTCLKLLDLGDGEDLREIAPNVISNLTRMEELCIPDHFDQWEDEATGTEERNASLVELNSLTCLTALKVHIPRGKSSPNNLCFENLVRFRISIGAPFGPIDEEEIPSAKMLKLEDVPLEDKFKVLLVKSEVVYVTKVKGLENVLHERDGSRFFNLKILQVEGCDGGENLLGRPEPSQQTLRQEMSRSFCNLTKLCVAHCSFKYLFSLSIARCLEQLQVLNVETCSCIEVIVGNERQGDDREIIFPQLRKMTLMHLPNLISFSTSKRPNLIIEASNSNPAQPLFGEKVVVSALEELEIVGLDDISEVWDKQFKPIVTEGIGSFGQLRSLVVGSCRRLVNVVPSNMRQRLRNLESLRIWQCESVVCDIENLTVVLPRLKSLYLRDLPNLREMGLNKKEDSLHGINVVYPNIRTIVIEDCPNLESIFSSSTARKLTHLGFLVINSGSSDSKLKAIVETSEERDGANNDEHFVFPELYFMQLTGMANLQSFCSSCGDEESLFNLKVVFPCLDYLEIWRLGNVKGIWNRTPPADSFQNLTHLVLVACHDLLYVAPSELLIGCLQNLRALVVMNCKLLEEVFKGRGSDSGEGIVSRHEPTIEEIDANVVLPQLRIVRLEQLPRLKSFSSGNELPSSVTRVIEDCPLLETHF
ncbi:hypothetical protein Vadar_031769 [Vaccinium darrowii]|uniref:Uncharacterized protein n=1 Tax=Vaccinium darrowii TaxID=229202 RepID=A0ACB7Z9Y3_9ERIC|nr:hypothetical protein Vadar_031769 [Vaccinium darrowii]